jgi:hypothetical protein
MKHNVRRSFLDDEDIGGARGMHMYSGEYPKILRKV